MADYEYEHICDAMPDELGGIVKMKGSATSQARFRKYIPRVGYFETALYGFEFCPYCGEKLGGDAS